MLVEQAKKKNNRLDLQEIKDEFKGMHVSEEWFGHILEYLKLHKVDVQSLFVGGKGRT